MQIDDLALIGGKPSNLRIRLALHLNALLKGQKLLPDRPDQIQEPVAERAIVPARVRPAEGLGAKLPWLGSWNLKPTKGLPRSSQKASGQGSSVGQIRTTAIRP